MIIIGNDNKLRPELVTVMGKLMRGHVSRYPVVAHYGMSGTFISFSDSRFPTTGAVRSLDHSIVYVDMNEDNGKITYVVSCKDICNEKYASHNSLYRTKETSNPNALLKLLKAYVHPLSAKRIADKFSKHTMQEKYYNWQRDIEIKFTELFQSVKAHHIIEELTKQRDVGVTFFNKDIQKIANEGKQILEERVKRNKTKSPEVFLHMNPDESWVAARGGNEMAYPDFHTLPEEFRDRVAILRMVENDTYVPGCGYKHYENTYRLHEGPLEDA